MSQGDAWGGTWAGVWGGSWGQDAPAPAAGMAGSLASGRRNKAWPKRKKRHPELEDQAALLTLAFKPRTRS